MGVRWVLANQSSYGHWTRLWYLRQCGQVPSPAGKCASAWSSSAEGSMKCSDTSCRRLTLSPVDQHQQTPRLPDQQTGDFTLNFVHLGLCASPDFLHTQGPGIQIRSKMYSSEKRTVDHWATDQFLSSSRKTHLTFVVQERLDKRNTTLCPGSVWWRLLMQKLLPQSTPCEAPTL